MNTPSRTLPPQGGGKQGNPVARPRGMTSSREGIAETPSQFARPRFLPVSHFLCSRSFLTTADGVHPVAPSPHNRVNKRKFSLYHVALDKLNLDIPLPEGLDALHEALTASLEFEHHISRRFRDPGPPDTGNDVAPAGHVINQRLVDEVERNGQFRTHSHVPALSFRGQVPLWTFPRPSKALACRKSRRTSSNRGDD